MSKIHRDIAAPKADAAPRSRHEILEETIEEAMRPYVGVLPPEGLKTMRDILEDALTTHPVALEALAELEGQPAADRSGTRPRDPGAEDDHDGGETGTKGGAA
jgi:hypothetical protein